MPNTFLAFDYGTKRIGLAVGNDLICSTQPLPAMATRQLFPADGKTVSDELRNLIREWKVDHLVFGAPLDAEGEATQLSKRIRKIGNALGRQLDLPVSFADERYSSGAADRLMREHLPAGKRFSAKKIALRDSVAAELILQTYFGV